MAIQTATYKKRLRKYSGLSKDARLVAIVIADMRYESKVHGHEPLSVSLTDLAAECGMHKNTLRRYLDECLKSRWVLARAVYRDGRQQPNEYFIVDPTDEAEYRRMYSVTASGGQILDTCVWTKSSMRLDTVLRSKNSELGSAPPQGGRVPDEQDEPQPAHELPAPPAAPAAAAGQAAATATTRLELVQPAKNVAAHVAAVRAATAAATPKHPQPKPRPRTWEHDDTRDNQYLLANAAHTPTTPAKTGTQ